HQRSGTDPRRIRRASGIGAVAESRGGRLRSVTLVHPECYAAFHFRRIIHANFFAQERVQADVDAMNGTWTTRYCGRAVASYFGAVSVLVFWILAPGPGAAHAQEGQEIELTLESTVQMAVERSYRVRQLRLGVERSRSYLRAEQAELKSRVYMNLRT